MPLDDPRLHAYLLAMQREWAVLMIGVGVAGTAGGILAAWWHPPLSALATTTFYTNAIVSLVAVTWAFGAQHRLGARLARQVDVGSRLALADRLGRRSFLPLAVSGIFAGGAAALAGEWINLAFLAPALGFGFLFFPTEARVRRRILAPGTSASPPESIPEP